MISKAVTPLLVLSLACSTCLGERGKPKKTPRKRPRDPAFKRVRDVPGLPRVLLIGDSISIGYTVPTQKLLKGKANVHRIPTNDGPTIRGVADLSSWLGKKQWDVIHFNWGLHDLKFMPNGQRQVPIDQYQKNLGELVKRLKATGAKLIWASTTPVPEGGVKPKRLNSDVVAYNAVAKKIMDANGVAIDDLYALALPRLKEIQQPVNVHFTEKGSAELAKQVAASILAALGDKTSRPATTSAAQPDYLRIVRAYADAMITHGRDTYGKVHSPLFAVTLDRKTHTLPTGQALEQLRRIPHEEWGIRPHDRMLTGANPMHDQNLYQVLYAHEIAGDRAYLQRADHFARRAIGLFLDDDSPLPKASSKHSHYEAITRADTLMMAMLDLWAITNAPEMGLTFVYPER